MNKKTSVSVLEYGVTNSTIDFQQSIKRITSLDLPLDSVRRALLTGAPIKLLSHNNPADIKYVITVDCMFESIKKATAELNERHKLERTQPVDYPLPTTQTNQSL